MQKERERECERDGGTTETAKTTGRVRVKYYSSKPIAIIMLVRF